MKPQNIYIAGHTGLVGSAFLKVANRQGFENIITRKHQELDLTRQEKVEDFFSSEKIDAVVIAAAKVGGILANKNFPADFFYENIAIGTNIIHAAKQSGVKKLIFLGSSCIYPKDTAVPIAESQLLSGPLEPTNEAYALAKISCLKMCDYYTKQYGLNYFSLMPCNLYGPGDNYHPEHSHVIPGLLRRFHEAKVNERRSVEVWGSGNPLREFLHSEDLAMAILLMLQTEGMGGHLNVGSGQEVSIRDLAHQVAEAVGYKGDIQFNSDYPDGVYRKVIDSQKINSLGWQPKINLQEGLRQAYQDALAREVFHC